MKKLPFILLILIAQFSVFGNINNRTDTLEIPFLEDWSSGDLETNGWMVSDQRWAVDLSRGNPFPSVQFDGRNLGGLYYFKLESTVFNAQKYCVGDVWLSFDVKLKSNEDSELGRLSVYGSHEGGWYNFQTIYNNDGSFDWKHYKINITEIALNKDFQILFKADGNGNSVNNWLIDNIQFYRSCTAPEQFEVKVDTNGDNQYQINFFWQMEEPEPGWIHWDDGVHVGGVGVSPVTDLYAAARWDAEQLLEYDGFRISKIRMVLNDLSGIDLTFHVWSGEQAATEIYHAEHDTIFEDEWIEHLIDSLIYLNAGEEIWVGYSIKQIGYGWPLGYDDGPAISNYGDMISTSGNSWDRLSELGIDNNFLIHFFLEDSVGNDIMIGAQAERRQKNKSSLFGFNLYQNIDEGEFELLEFIPWVSGDTSHNIMFTASPDLRCFQLTAIWANESDTCESDPAISKDNPEEDFVCVLLVGEEENPMKITSLVKCYPNPFSHSTTFEYSLEKPQLIEISIYNQLGKRVGLIRENQIAGKQRLVWKPAHLPQGVYYFAFSSGPEVQNGKLIFLK